MKVIHPDNLDWIGEKVLKKWGVEGGEVRTIIASAIKTEVEKKYDLKRVPRTSVSLEHGEVKYSLFSAFFAFYTSRLSRIKI